MTLSSSAEPIDTKRNMECKDALAGKYNQLCICYEGNNKCSKLLSVLEGGLDKLCSLVPWIAGYSVKEEISGEWGIVNQRAAAPTVAVRVATQPGLETLKQSAFSAKWFDERLIAPCATFSQDDDTQHPVFLAQLNAIQNGVMLVFCAERSAMDFVGFSYILKLLDKACTDETISEQELAIANSGRNNPIEPGMVPDFIVPTPGKWPDPERGPAASAAASPPTWFHIAIRDQQDVVSDVCRELGCSVSVEDVISAFIYQVVTASRASRLAPGTTIRLARAVDNRAQLDIHPEHPGNTEKMLYTEATVGDLLNEPLHQTVLRVKTASTANPLLCRDLDPHRDISVCDWSKCEAYQWSFGLDLGLPLRVLRPTFMPVESVAYILPAKPTGRRSPVALCLTQEDYASLKRTGCYIRYACDDA